MNNLNPVENIFDKATAVILGDQKKDAIHQELLLFMKKNPVSDVLAPKKWLNFYPFNINNGVFKTPQVVLAGLLIFLLVGLVTSASASVALPGDFLYPVKVGFNEKIQEALAFSDQAKLQVHIQLAKTRLQEAEQLSTEGKLSNTSQVQITNSFKSQMGQVSKYLGKLQLGKSDEVTAQVASSLEASLKAHAIIIHGLQKNKTDTSNAFANEIQVSTNQLSTNNTNAAIFNSDDHKKSVVEQKMVSVQHSIDKVRKILKERGREIGTNAVLQSENNLDLAQQKVDEQKAAINNEHNDYNSSISLLGQADVITQESQDLINEKTKLHVNVPITIESQNSVGGSDNKINNLVK